MQMNINSESGEEEIEIWHWMNCTNPKNKPDAMSRYMAKNCKQASRTKEAVQLEAEKATINSGRSPKSARPHNVDV